MVSQLTATRLKKRYKSRTVVHDVSLDVASGEVVGLLGPNGAGKTTCFYMIVGLVPADSGSIRIDDTDLTHPPIHPAPSPGRRSPPAAGPPRRAPRHLLPAAGELGVPPPDGGGERAGYPRASGPE